MSAKPGTARVGRDEVKPIKKTRRKKEQARKNNLASANVLLHDLSNIRKRDRIWRASEAKK